MAHPFTACLRKVMQKFSLVWRFSPPRFFEAAFTYTGSQCRFEIGNDGIVIAQLPMTEFGADFDAMEVELSALFLGAMLLRRRPCALTGWGVHMSDGGRGEIKR